MTVANRLQSAFRVALELPEDADVTELKYRDIEQWDSIGHMTLVAEIENEFDVMFSTEEVVNLSSYTAALDMLRERGVSDS